MNDPIESLQSEADEKESRIQHAIGLAVQFGGVDGAHHKAWVIDRMVRVLAGDRYNEIVTEARNGDDGPQTYDWDCGVAP